jgi:hypothetical protein
MILPMLGLLMLLRGSDPQRGQATLPNLGDRTIGSVRIRTLQLFRIDISNRHGPSSVPDAIR